MADFAWRARVRATRRGQATAYVRKHQFEVGAPVQFDEQHDQVSALEYVLAAIGADVVKGFQAAADRRRLSVDQIEAVVSGQLDNPLVHLGVVGEEGHPGLEAVSVRVFVSTDEGEARVRAVWDEALGRSPLARTFASAVRLDLSIRVAL
jgi:OsmC-like protein